MKEEHIDKFDLDRIISAVEDKYEVNEVDKSRYKVWNKEKEDPEKHSVNLRTLECTCPDYKYNCQKKERELGDTKVCKHIIHAIFKVHSLI